MERYMLSRLTGVTPHTTKLIRSCIALVMLIAAWDYNDCLSGEYNKMSLLTYVH